MQDRTKVRWRFVHGAAKGRSRHAVSDTWLNNWGVLGASFSMDRVKHYHSLISRRVMGCIFVTYFWLLAKSFDLVLIIGKQLYQRTLAIEQLANFFWAGPGRDNQDVSGYNSFSATLGGDSDTTLAIDWLSLPVFILKWASNSNAFS